MFVKQTVVIISPRTAAKAGPLVVAGTIASPLCQGAYDQAHGASLAHAMNAFLDVILADAHSLAHIMLTCMSVNTTRQAGMDWKKTIG